MPEYSFLNLEQIAEAQADKEITANAILEALAKGTGALDVSVASGNVTLSETQSHYGVIRLTGAPGASRVVTVDADISRAILFINASTGGQVIEVEQTGGTNFPVPAGGAVLLLSTTQAITYRIGQTASLTLSASLTSTQWANQPAGLTEWFGNTTQRAKFDLTQFTEARVLVNVAVAGAATPAKIRLQYSPDESTWDYLDASSGPTVSINTTGLKVSAWVTISQAARGDMFLRLVGIDGDGAADPSFGSGIAQFR